MTDELCSAVSKAKVKENNEEECSDDGVPFHLQTDRILFREKKRSLPKISYSSKKDGCPFVTNDEETSDGIPANCRPSMHLCSTAPVNQLPKKPFCTMPGSQFLEKERPAVELIPIGDDWTRFDITAGVTIQPDYSVHLEASFIVEEDEEIDVEFKEEELTTEKCKCSRPFCPTCKFAESSSESMEEIPVEKSVSFDDELLEPIDSDLWLNPIPRRRVLQFPNHAARERYKTQLLDKMKDTAKSVKRSDWITFMGDFDRFVTAVMDESSDDTYTDTSGSESQMETVQYRKLRKKKRMMFGVDDMKANAFCYSKYVRHYMNFMEDLKVQMTEPPSQYWPRFMKTFAGYGSNPSELDPEWLGLLLMAPTECFREISSSSSNESLPQLSDPGSTTTTMSSSECSPLNCAVDSTEQLRRAGVCMIVNDSEEVANEGSRVTGGVYSNESRFNLHKSVSFTQVSDSRLISSKSLLVDSVKRQQSEVKSRSQSRQKYGRQKSLRVPQDSLLAEQVSEFMTSIQSRISSRMPSSKLAAIKKELLSDDDEIVLITHEQQPSITNKIMEEEVGEGHFDEGQEEGFFGEAAPEFDSFKRNVIFIFRGKLYKINYDCTCEESCTCDPQEVVEKYIDTLLDEIYGTVDIDEVAESEVEGEMGDEKKPSPGSALNSDLSQSHKLRDFHHSGELDSHIPSIRATSSVDCYRYLLNVDDDSSRFNKYYDKDDVQGGRSVAPEGIEAHKEFYKNQELIGKATGVWKKKKGRGKQEDSNAELFEVSTEEIHQQSKSESQSSISLGRDSHSSTDSSVELCKCCRCEQRYEEQGMVVRHCKKKHCTCCQCKGKIIKIAKKLHIRKKGSRFLYVLFKKIRRAINKPSLEIRNQYLQGIVDRLRETSQKLPKKKWPFYFKEVMVTAGLESSSGSTSLSEHGVEEQKHCKKKVSTRKRLTGKTQTYTSAEIQKREWVAWKARTMEEDKSTSRYMTPQKAVQSMADMTRWENSEAYYEYVGFILAMNEAIKGHSCKEKFPRSQHVNAILTLLDRFSEWIDEIPPVQQPQRFGNKSFRSWITRLQQEGPKTLVDLMPSKFHGGLGETQAYLLEGFGNFTRIDYGTGHEMAFTMFLCCLFKIGLLDKEDELPVVLYVFPRYLSVARKLQTVYKMEPAGSRGVWALDDFQFIPFLWGSSQLIGHPHIRPSSFTKQDIALGFHDHYMFLACIKYINENKIGPFAEHSNQLWNISAVPTWDKVNSGLIKMYKGEVLSKFPVIQHVLFGSILPITPAPPSQTERVYKGLIREGLQPNNQIKPCMEPPPPVPPPAPAAPGDRSSVGSSNDGDEYVLTEKFQNVPDQKN